MRAETQLEQAVAAAGEAATEAIAAPPATAIVEALGLLNQRDRRRAVPAELAPPGQYLALQGFGGTELVAIDRDVTHVGRGLTADLRLDDARVSRRHAIIARRGSTVRVLDDRSANGTFVNGRRIAEADLEDGDVILVGPVVLRYVDSSRATGADRRSTLSARS